MTQRRDCTGSEEGRRADRDWLRERFAAVGTAGAISVERRDGTIYHDRASVIRAIVLQLAFHMAALEEEAS